MVTGRTGLVAEQARPPGGAGALPRQRVAAEAGRERKPVTHTEANIRWRMGRRVRVPERVLHPAGAVFVTQEPVLAGGAETVLAAGPFEAVVAQTRPVDVVALGPVLAVALVGALRPVGADGAFVLAPALAGEEEVTRSSLAGVQLLWRIKGFKNLSDSFTDNWSTPGLSLRNSSAPRTTKTFEQEAKIHLFFN